MTRRQEDGRAGGVPAWIRRIAGVLAGAAFFAAAGAGAAVGPQMDRPDARAHWRAQWNDEAGKQPFISHDKNGGPWSNDFRRRMLDAAGKERLRWGRMIPGLRQTGTAFSDASLSPAIVGAASPGALWTNLGPTRANIMKNGVSLKVTDAGRVTGILIDPSDDNIIYAAFSGGGLWKTVDGGATWAPKTDGLGTLSVGSLAMDPNNRSVLYLGLGDAFDGTGIGLVKSVDAGETWTDPVFLGDSRVINAVQVAPKNSSIVLAATNRGLFRSTDAGATWVRVALPTGRAAVPYIWSIAWTGENGFAVSLEADPTRAGGSPDAQVMVTTDNGATWTRANGFTASSGIARSTLASAPSNRNILYAMATAVTYSGESDLAELFRSDDGGLNWKPLGIAGKQYTNVNREARLVSTLLRGQGWYNQMIQIDTANPDIAYFGGCFLVAKTTDGGGSFTQLSNWLGQFDLPYVHADFHRATMKGQTLIIGTDGGLFRSTDGGKTFSDALNVGLTTHLIYTVASSPANLDAIIGGFQDNGTRVRVGATSTFNQYIGGDGFGAAIHRTRGDTMLGTLYYTRIYKSRDGGVTFEPSGSGIAEAGDPARAPFNTGIVYWEGQADTETVFTWVNNKVYRSTNFGNSWSALPTAGFPADIFIRGFGVATSNVNILGVVANGGRVFLSTNGGANWSQAGALPNNGLSLSRIAFDPVDPNTLYVSSVAADASRNHLWKSTDFGATWNAIDGNGFPFGIPVNVVKVDPTSPETIYAGTHLGVYRSIDAGITWARFGTGLPLVNVDDIWISPDASIVRVASFGRGFWQLRNMLTIMRR